MGTLTICTRFIRRLKIYLLLENNRFYRLHDFVQQQTSVYQIPCYRLYDPLYVPIKEVESFLRFVSRILFLDIHIHMLNWQ